MKRYREWGGLVLLGVMLLCVLAPSWSEGGARTGGVVALAPSLRDTAVDGDSALAPSGGLRVDERLRNLFDYYLSANGERSLPEIRRRLNDDLSQRLPPMQLKQALDLYDRYLSYQQTLAMRAAHLANGGALAERLAAARRLRGRYFSEDEILGLFGDEDTVDDFELARRALMADPTLDAFARQRKIAALEAALPEALRTMREDSLTPIKVARAERLSRLQGADEQQIFALRQRMVGTAAAERLAALDQERGVWQRRIDNYRDARQVLREDASLGQEARRAALLALCNNLFTPEERLRLAAYVPEGD